MSPGVPTARAEKRQALSVVLRQLAADESRARVSVADLLAALGDRAVAALLFVFAVPNLLPTPPGTSAVIGTPLLFLSAQLMFGLKPWLPAFIARRSMAHADFRALVERVAPWLQHAEKLLRPRASGIALPPMEYLIGLLCLLLAVVLVLPIPFGNIPPALAISLMSLGILERDGLWVLAGLIAAAVATVIASGVIVAMAKAAFFLISRLLGSG